MDPDPSRPVPGDSPGAPRPGGAAPGAHPRALEPGVLAFTLLLSVAGAVVGMEIVTSLGVTPNTSIVGVILAIVVSRLPLRALRAFRSVHRQNLVQTTISSATFGAANSLLVPLGVPVLLGRPGLVLPMLAGAAAGMLIDLAMLYWLFDSRLFPGSGPWPVGIASAEAILAGDEGGRRARLLGVGAGAGILGSSGLFGALRGVGPGALPMAAFGIAFLGNVWALGMFGVGLLVRGYAPGLLGVELAEALVPHGMMIGAGLVALGQAVVLVAGGRGRAGAGWGRAGGAGEPETPPPGPGGAPGTAAGRRAAREGAPTRTEAEARAGVLRGLLLYVGAAVLLAALGGLWGGMGGGRLGAWILFAAAACVAAEFIVGLSAMQAGWFPAFATALVFLLLALVGGFPPEAAALLVGFVASGGPAFADAGYDLKTGWLLRGRGGNPGFELEGRREQVVAAAVGLLTALAMVALFHGHYFAADRFPPVDRVYAAAIEAGIDPARSGRLLLWAVPGALLQLLGGRDRQMGILFATGLLIRNPLAGWAVLLGLAVRRRLSRGEGPEADASTTVFAGGIIAGDALWGFLGSYLR